VSQINEQMIPPKPADGQDDKENADA
jgi:hypothetical protein